MMYISNMYCSVFVLSLPTGFEPMTLWLTATRSTY